MKIVNFICVIKISLTVRKKIFKFEQKESILYLLESKGH